jgi:release factor glutamine methyltransferase
VTTVRGALDGAAERLAAAGCPSPRTDAAFLLAHALGVSRAELHADGSRRLSDEESSAIEALVVRRERREPLAYVLGEWDFRRLTLRVDARVLVPRPETEILVERCLALLEGLDQPRVLDVGTGSGAIALALADERPGARVVGIDSSPDALEIARANADRLALDVEFECHDVRDGLPAGPWDLVVSNPPYVSEAEISSLEPEVREWEPRVALVGEGVTEAIARRSHELLRDGGVLTLETAEADAERVAALLEDIGFRDVGVTPDLAGRPRVVEGVA